MRRPYPILAILATVFFVASAHASSFELAAAAPTERQTKWPTKTIRISISSSLTSSAPGIKPGSDVAGAIRRALDNWANAANLNLITLASNSQSISPSSGGDGISLITIAPTPENLAAFSDGDNTARTRLFFDPETGVINEGDIVINPFPYAADGSPILFSTDGTRGTYDLESTLAHEIGHLLGLGHSSVIGSTMQASQGLNGTYGFTAITERSLSEVDRVAAQDVYEACTGFGSVEGRILSSFDGRLSPVSVAHVWVEDLSSGRVIGSVRTDSTGTFRIGCLPPASYRAMVEHLDGLPDPWALTAASTFKSGPGGRAFRSVEITTQLQIVAEKASTLNYVIVPPQSSRPLLNPRLVGTNGELSTIPLPATSGSKLTVFVSGEGLDQIPGNGLSISSPFITVDASSLTLQRFANSPPIISFEVTIGANVPAGDYTIRLQSNSGEVAFLPGGITVGS